MQCGASLWFLSKTCALLLFSSAAALVHTAALVAYLDNGTRSSTVLDTNAQKNAGRRAATAIASAVVSTKLAEAG